MAVRVVCPAPVDVLLAEDDAPLRGCLRALLEREGYRCAEAADGPEAVRLALRSPPRCVFLDLALPGMGGLAVARRLRADPRTRGSHIHCLTGLSGPGLRGQARQAGCDLFLTKPVSPAAVVEAARGGRPPAGAGEADRLLGGRLAGTAVIFLDRNGYVRGWNAGARRLLGYRGHEVRGEHFCRLSFRPEEVRRGEPEYELDAAGTRGRVAVARWYARRDGTALWCVGLTAGLRDRAGRLRGFAKLLRDRTGQALPGGWPGPSGVAAAAGSLGDLDGLLAAVLGRGQLLVGEPGPGGPAGDRG